MRVEVLLPQWGMGMSEGIISQEGLKPRHFEVHQGNNRSKDAIVDFDWENQMKLEYTGYEDEIIKKIEAAVR